MLEEQKEGMLSQLPEDVLVDILGRLAPRYLATSRCVCKLWRTIIDTRCLLRSDVLPLSLSGIFINFHDLTLSEFFSRSSTVPPPISNYLPVRWYFGNHCNGLLLCINYVVNPATQQWVQLPLPPPPSPYIHSMRYFHDHKGYLVFDPTLSPHYDVILIPNVQAFEPASDELEWPPSQCKLYVFSSRTNGWEERSFVREGDAAGTVADMRLDFYDLDLYDCYNSVYWRGALYVHCQKYFVMRISLLDGKYQVIKPPAEVELIKPSMENELTRDPFFYLGRSQKGVYCAVNCHSVYILDESNGKMDWVLKARISLTHKQIDRSNKPWTVQDVNCFLYDDDAYSPDYDNEMMEQKCKWQRFGDNSVVETKEWDSDDDDLIDTKCWRNGYCDNIGFLGFHPYKEVVFLSEGMSLLAYHLNSSKVQDIGFLYPTQYTHDYSHPYITGSFPYTPWMGEFPEGN